jgi:hypothetical protein
MTSPIPTVVAFALIFTVLAPISKLPFTDDGFALCRFKIPLIVKSFPAVIPAPFIVRLLIFPVNNEAGSVIAVKFVKNKLAPELLASIFPEVLEGVFPEIINVLAPIVSVPVVNVTVPAILTDPPKLIPFARFSVKSLSAIAGKLVLAPLPPTIILDELPPVKVPVVVETDPFSVKVFAPMV